METKVEMKSRRPARQLPGPLRWLLQHLRRRWMVYAGLLISAYFLYSIFSEMWANLANVWNYMLQARYLWVIPGVAVYFFGVWARTWRWHYMLRPVQKVPLKRLFPIVCIGYMGNNIYPFRAGEVLRSYVLYRDEKVDISASLATIIAERVFDGIIMLLFVFIGLPFVTFGNDAFMTSWRPKIILFTLAFFGALVVFFLIAVSPKRTQAVSGWFIQRLVPQRLRAPIQNIVNRFVEGLRCLRSPADMGMIFITSTVVWLAETVKYWFVLHAFQAIDPSFNVPFYILMLMNGVVNLFTTLPSAPGYAGTFDWSGIKVLESYLGPSYQGIAAAYTFALHVALWFPITALGAFYMLRRRVSLGKARQEVAAEKAAEAALATPAPVDPPVEE